MIDSGEVEFEEMSSSVNARQLTAVDPKPASTGNQHADLGEGPSSPERARSSRSSSRFRKLRRLVPIVIIDKSALFRAGLMYVLEGSRFRVTASSSSLGDLSERAFNGKHRIALISLDREAAATLSRVSRLTSQHKSLQIITLTERFCPDELLTAIKAGAAGYLLKNEISPDQLLKSLELVLLGAVVIPPGLKSLKDPMQLQLDAIPAGQHLETVSVFGQPPPAGDAAQMDDVGRLSNREQTILKQLTQGASNKQIARDLNIAEATVKVHVKSLLRKIHVSNRTQAAMWAIQSWRTTSFAVFLCSCMHDVAQLM
jgi:two-component system nitrate/nitrite response regulator NarL